MLTYAFVALCFGKLIQLQYREEGFLGDLYITDLPHSLLAFLLFLQQLSFPGDIAAIAFGGDIFPECLYGLPRDDLGAYGCLNGDLELLSRYQLLQLDTHLPPELIGIITVDECRQGIDRFFVDQDIKLDKVGTLVA